MPASALAPLVPVLRTLDTRARGILRADDGRVLELVEGEDFDVQGGIVTFRRPQPAGMLVLNYSLALRPASGATGRRRSGRR